MAKCDGIVRAGYHTDWTLLFMVCASDRLFLVTKLNTVYATRHLL
ncbi:MAG: hypothetical protein ACM37W_04820 [Actinomycetota bacterium]